MISEINKVSVRAVGVDPDVQRGVGGIPLAVGLQVEDERVRGREPLAGLIGRNGSVANVTTDDGTGVSLTNKDEIFSTSDGALPGVLVEIAWANGVYLVDRSGIGPVEEGLHLRSGESHGDSSTLGVISWALIISALKAVINVVVELSPVQEAVTIKIVALKERVDELTLLVVVELLIIVIRGCLLNEVLEGHLVLEDACGGSGDHSEADHCELEHQFS